MNELIRHECLLPTRYIHYVETEKAVYAVSDSCNKLLRKRTLMIIKVVEYPRFKLNGVINKTLINCFHFNVDEGGFMHNLYKI